jgi:hypothetical protein
LVIGYCRLVIPLQENPAMPPRSKKRRLSSAALAAIFCSAALIAGPAWAQPDTEQIDVTIVKAEPHGAPEGLSMRARLAAITPAEPSEIRWRYGGEGQGGEVSRGVFPKPGAAADAEQTLDVGQWSAPVDVVSLVKGRFPAKFFLTVTAGRPGRTVDRITRELAGYSTDVVFEFEFSYGGKVVKRLSEKGPDGGTVTLVVPAYRLVGDVQPDSPAFLDELCGVLQYAQRRAEMLEGLPWGGGPLPKKYVLINNVSGYGQGFGYGVRTTDKAVTRAELRSLRQLGVNALRTPPAFILDGMRSGVPEMQAFRRGIEVPVAGFPVPRYQAGRPADPEAGCPFAPGVAERTAADVKESLDRVLKLPVDEVWGLTVDEIGSVFDASPEGKSHMAVCPRCAAGFREYLKANGLRPADFGKSDWSEVRPIDIFSKEGPRPSLDDPATALAAFWTRKFNNFATAMLFTPLRDAFAKANAAKRQAASAGGDAPAARQPWLYSFALRGNTFLMKGHSLDFFDFYRHADNAIVYETSNREPRIWSWDSYLCDVQRVVGRRMGVAQGIYIKPHRGAPLQRMLSAAGRGDRMIYWYTYGPDYHKGDSFSQDRDALVLASKAAHLLGRAEDVLYGSRWAVPARVAVVKPETTQRWMNLLGDPPQMKAAWENAKWVYTALQHAHVPVDPLDETMLAEDDLSPYAIIYVSGTHVTRAAAEGLRRYVEQGGALCTSGWGLARDEANQPLDVLRPVLGLSKRGEPEMWYDVQLYGATNLEPYDDPRSRLADVPAGAAIRGQGLFAAELRPVVGRETLDPAEGAEVLARFADGKPAAVSSRYGKGRAYVVGFYPGLEYSAAVRRPDYNMRRDFDAGPRRFVAAPALECSEPVVDAADPLVEGVLLVNPADGRRCVTLANWAYGVTAIQQDERGRRTPVVSHLPIEDLEVTVRGAGKVSKATSCWLDRPLKVEVSGDQVRFTLPRLEEGDVVVLEP